MQKSLKFFSEKLNLCIWVISDAATLSANPPAKSYVNKTCSHQRPLKAKRLDAERLIFQENNYIYNISHIFLGMVKESYMHINGPGLIYLSLSEARLSCFKHHLDDKPLFQIAVSECMNLGG